MDQLPLALGALAFALHIATAQGYGIFRDELYYIACGEHLDFGFVDHPPLIALVTALVRATLGDSLYALRFLPALAAGATVWLASAIAREMGGGRYARVVAAVTTMLAPIFLAMFGLLTMNAFDVLIWAWAAWLVLRILGAGRERLWPWLGVLLGIGLENKISVLFLGFGLFVGLVTSGRWRVLLMRGPWIAAGIALLIFLPHLIWQQAHGWPTREFMDNARRQKNVDLTPLAFLTEFTLLAGPLAAPVWIGGLAWLFFADRARAQHVLGWAFLAILAVMLSTQAKAYYLAPVLTFLFAAGGVAIEAWTARVATRTVRALVIAVLVAGGAAIAPLTKPLLSEDAYVRYEKKLGIRPSAGERHEQGRLPQHFADMHGWRELAEAVARVHASLSADERARTFVFGQNYGEAGAIDFFGPALGLPKAISAHNSYWLWGPRDTDREIGIVLGDDRERLEELFEEVELGATFTCDDCMPYENHLPIWIVRRARSPLAELLLPKVLAPRARFFRPLGRSVV